VKILTENEAGNDVVNYFIKLTKVILLLNLDRTALLYVIEELARIIDLGACAD
jgi:hypothetical protein